MSSLCAVEALDPGRHDISGFESGRAVLDRWLTAYAGQSQRRDVARTFVATEQDSRVVGYCTLVAGHADAPDAVAAKVSRHYPIPVCILARVAVTATWQGRGLGSDLLRDALKRTLAAAQEIGIRAVLVHAIDQPAARFYSQYGFEAATDDGLTLMVPIAAVREELARV